jgi:hypothetical protein
MKPIKFILLALGAICLIAVFLPFIDVGPIKFSFWELRKAKAAPTFIALLASLGLIVMAKSFGRGRAAGAAVLGLVIAIITIIQFEAEMPFGKVAGMGAKLLLMGGLAGFAASVVALIKPDRGLA